jgi:hypothetical protein
MAMLVAHRQRLKELLALLLLLLLSLQHYLRSH